MQIHPVIMKLTIGSVAGGIGMLTQPNPRSERLESTLP
jgi:hypothetical protein